LTSGAKSAVIRALVCTVDGTCMLTREEIGAKAWGVNRMRSLGLSVPPAIVATTHACREYFANGRVVDDALWAQIVEHMKALEEGTGRRLGSTQQPLLVSVRSGAAQSMPGMMDTVLNLGINAEVAAALTAESGDGRYADDTHQRFVELYRKVVLGEDSDLVSIPTDPWAQLRAAVAAVFNSWHSPLAKAYRRNRGMADDGGTAVMIQAMVFGNIDAQSGTGVLFSRNPMTGEPLPWGEWLSCAQGEDVVSGQLTPKPLDTLREQMPDVHGELMHATATLETDSRDIQDIEFTVESGRLWLLQTRVAKRSPQAAVRAAVAFAEEGLISREAALCRLDADQIRKLPALRLVPQAAEEKPVAFGEPACPGVATGLVVTDPDEADARSQMGEDVILARPTTSPEDLKGVIAALGVMTEQGGSTSHAAVVSRELGRPCVVGCGSNTVVALAGQRATLDGSSGRVWTGDLTLDHSEEAASEDVRKLIEWGLPLIPIRLPQVGAETADSINLDAHGDGWRAALRPGITVHGHVLDTDEGIQAAMASGVRAAVVRRRLPALLACLSALSHSAAHSVHVAAGATPTDEIPEFTLLRLAELKGRATADILADALTVPVNVADDYYLPLCGRGLCSKSGSGYCITGKGRDQLKMFLADERAHADPAAVVALYEDFCVFNADLKQIMTAWQLKPDGGLNDHRDSEYERGVLQRLADLHLRVGPLLRRLAKLSPRLAAYESRLGRAAARVAAGDRRYVARIIADSYHTVWFELHEELLSIAGLKREVEARAGRLGTGPAARSHSE
jgi:pyruvate,orthophosphate dikinase